MSFVNRIFKNTAKNATLYNNTTIRKTNHNKHRINNLRWLQDPIRSLNFNIPIPTQNNKFDLHSCVDIDDKLIKHMINLNKNNRFNDENINYYDLGESYLNIVFNYNSLTQSSDQPVNNKIINIIESRFNYNALTNIQKHSSSIFKNVIGKHSLNIHSYDNSHTSSLSQSPKFNLSDFESNINEKPIKTHSHFFDKNYLSSHTTLGSQSSGYKAIRESSAFFEKTYSRILKVSGANSDYFLNQLLSISVSQMCSHDVQYACILDSKGVILDTCFISRFDSHYLLVTTGNKKNDVLDYVSSYSIHLSSFGLDVSVNSLDRINVCNLYGPLSYDIFMSLLTDKSNKLSIKHPEASPTNELSEENKTNTDFPKLFMKSFHINFMNIAQPIIGYRVSDVEEGFEFLVPNECYRQFKDLLLSNTHVQPIDFETYDIARLESGIIRPDIDLTPDSTPLHSSLMWNVDIDKIRNKTIFGHKNFGINMVDGVTKVRVGLISNKPLTSNCKVLTKSTRMPIGIITSSAFSPALGMYISHCYVNRDYAKHDLPVVISVPEKPNDTVSKTKYKKYYRNNVLKNFCSGTIVRLPFIKRTSKLSVEHDRNVDKTKYLKPKSIKMSGEKQLVRADKVTGVKTKKQIWKDIIKKHKRKLNATLELACKKWEGLAKETTQESTDNNVEDKNIKTDKVENTSLECKLDYYKNKIDVEVRNRHRRYRPN